MMKFITLLISCSLALATSVQAEQKQAKKKQAKQSHAASGQQPAATKARGQGSHKQQAPKVENAKVQKHQVTRQHVQASPNINNAKAKKHQVTSQHVQASPNINHVKAKKHQVTGQQVYASPNVQAKKLPDVQSKKHAAVQSNKLPAVQSNDLPAVQSNKLARVKADKRTVENIRAQHTSFRARPSTTVTSVQFNQSYRIRGAENWHGTHYEVFRSYRPVWHDRVWWHAHYPTVVLIGGGWYFWNAGYWYPAWGYDSAAAYYPYDGPIYVGSSARPFDQIVADVQAVLQYQGYYGGEVDGLVGPLTQGALAAYQRDHGLVQTAAIDQPTLDSLGLG